MHVSYRCEESRDKFHVMYICVRPWRFAGLPDEVEDLGAFAHPVAHPIPHGHDDGVGFVVSPVLRALLRSPWQDVIKHDVQ